MLPEDLLTAFQYLKGAYKKAEQGLFTKVCSDRTRGNGFKLEEVRFRLDISPRDRVGSILLRVLRELTSIAKGCSVIYLKAPSDQGKFLMTGERHTPTFKKGPGNIE